VFGWCLQCLADTDCELVEIQSERFDELGLSFSPGPAVPHAQQPTRLHLANVDQSPWIIAVVAFLMISWGLILLAAGLFIAPSPSAPPGSPFGGFNAILGVGGGMTALLGLGLMVVVSRQSGIPTPFLFPLLSAVSFLIGLGILVYGLFNDQPRSKVPLLLGSGLAVFISLVALGLERSHKGKALSVPYSSPWKFAPSVDWTKAGGNKRLG
jgi:hypothetical protein